MIIYKDIFTGDEMFTDSYPMELQDDMLYLVEGKRVTERNTVTDAMIGGNASAEDAAEEHEDGSVSGINIVLANRLKEMKNPYTGKEYQTHMKGYLKKMKERFQEAGTEEAMKRLEYMKEKMPAIMKDLKKRINANEIEFFWGEHGSDESGMLILLDYKADGKTPYLMFWKDGLKEEKL